MNFKYKEQHKKCLPCPPDEAVNVATAFDAFRLVTSDNLKSDDFIPPAMLNPRRGFKGGQKCSAYALSYFTTENGLEKHYKKLAKNNASFARVWCFIAKSRIDNSDGKVTPVSTKGHFDLHESRTANLLKNSIYIRKI